MGRSISVSTGYAIVLEEWEGDYAEGIYEALEEKFDDDEFSFSDWVDESLTNAGITNVILEFFGYDESGGMAIVARDSAHNFYDCAAPVPSLFTWDGNERQYDIELRSALAVLGLDQLNLAGKWMLFASYG